MTKSELNQAWAELEGWTIWPVFDHPDFTEPNRFFSEVVPRMEELGYTPKIEKNLCGNWYVFFESIEDESYISEGTRKNVGKAGLEAAIKARKKLMEAWSQLGAREQFIIVGVIKDLRMLEKMPDAAVPHLLDERLQIR